MDNAGERVAKGRHAAGSARVYGLYVGCTGAGLRIFARQRVFARAGLPFPRFEAASTVAGGVEGRREP